jgi:hypothetical protein
LTSLICIEPLEQRPSMRICIAFMWICYHHDSC